MKLANAGVLLALALIQLSVSFSVLDRRTAIFIAIVISSCFWFSMKASDPYGLFHLTLNKLPGEDPSALPRTEWLNMGYWKTAKTFPEACQALAIKLTKAADLKSGARILDVGFGTGESLILLLSHPSVPRPSSLTGITSLQAHCARAQDRVARLQASSSDETVVKLHAEDAVFRSSSKNHPLDPDIQNTFDAILALDCAFHFKSRSRFLRQSFDRLAPGGRIALADICFNTAALESRSRSLVISLLRFMPQDNVVSKEQYLLDLHEIGFVDVKMEDVSDDVFPEFIRFLKGRGGWGWWIFGKIMDWYTSLGARYVIVSGAKPKSTRA